MNRVLTLQSSARVAKNVIYILAFGNGVQCGYGGTVSPVRKAAAVCQAATTGVTRSWTIILSRLNARLYAVMLVTSVADRSEVHGSYFSRPVGYEPPGDP